MSKYAEALAKRVTGGAEGLAAFAKGISDAEWNTRMSPTDPRTIGQVVNHVALMYPIEVDVTRSIAQGKDMAGLTHEVVAGVNAKQVEDHPSPTRAGALELLRKNSAEAAAAIAALTDEELNGAAPFGLASGATITAQFVIEDHAIRHSWHHLGRIRARLGR